MPRPLRIFIGSSKEALPRAKDLQDLLYEEDDGGRDRRGIIVRGWWSNEVFRVGDMFIESLERVMKETDAAILLATEDDQTTVRGKTVTEPRDNITFESGMAISAHGRKRTALALIGEPKLPNGLDDIKHLQLHPGDSADDFRERNRGRIRALVDQWKGAIDAEDFETFRTDNQDRESIDRLQPDTRANLSMVDSSIADREVAYALVDEIGNYSAALLSRTNLVSKYQINRIAVPELCKKMSSCLGAPGHGRSTPHLVTLAEYLAFENERNWRFLGYNIQRAFEAEDGTQGISGLSERQTAELVKTAGTSPYQSISSAGSEPSEPVRSISWFDAVAYCLSVGGRLPTLEDLNRSSGERRRDIWEWTQTWFSESAGHVSVSRLHRRPIGVNPDFRLPNLGFRVILER